MRSYELDQAVLWMTASEFALAIPLVEQDSIGMVRRGFLGQLTVMHFASGQRDGHLAVLAKFVEALTCECGVVCGRARSMAACESETFWEYSPSQGSRQLGDLMDLVGDGKGAYVSRVNCDAPGQHDLGLRQIHSGMRVEAVEGHDVVGLPLPLVKLRITSAAAAASPYGISIIFGVVGASEASQAATCANRGEDLFEIMRTNERELTSIPDDHFAL
jgi:hypothetical protein